MATYHRRRGPFKSYGELARHLTEAGRLELPRPSHCLRCGVDCGFTRHGHYFRDFVFLDAIAEHVGVERYLCRKNANATFAALAAFQEPGAHYAVDLRGDVLERVFVRGESKRAACDALRLSVGGRLLARSTVTRWCARFLRRAPRHAAVLRAHLSQRMPGRELRATSDPGGMIRLARAGFRLHRRWPRARFWEWFHELLWSAARRHPLSPGPSRARRDRRPHVSVIPLGPCTRLPLRPVNEKKEGPHERTRPQGTMGPVLVPRPGAALGGGP